MIITEATINYSILVERLENILVYLEMAGLLSYISEKVFFFFTDNQVSRKYDLSFGVARGKLTWSSALLVIQISLR